MLLDDKPVFFGGGEFFQERGLLLGCCCLFLLNYIWCTTFLFISPCSCFYSPYGAYAQSKLALVLFAYHLQHLLTGERNHVTINVVDPGIVNTDLYQNVGWLPKVGKKITGWLFKVCEESNNFVSRQYLLFIIERYVWCFLASLIILAAVFGFFPILLMWNKNTSVSVLQCILEVHRLSQLADTANYLGSIA